MKLELSQQEMESYVNENKTMIWQFNTLYQIDYSRNLGNGEYYLRKVFQRPKSNLGVTRKGRFIAMNQEQAQKYL